MFTPLLRLFAAHKWLGLLLVFLLPATAGFAQPPQANKYYFISSEATAKVIDISSGGTANGTKVQLWSKGGVDAQQFKFIDAGGGYYKIEPKCAPGKVICIEGASQNHGVKVHLWDNLNLPDQQFRFDNVGGGYYYITAKHSNKIIAVANASTADGAQLIQHDRPGTTTHKHTKWKLVEPVVAATFPTGRVYRFMGDNFKPRYHVDGSLGIQGISAVIYDETLTGIPIANKKFMLYSVSDGYYTITIGDKCFTAQSNNTCTWSPCINGSASQQFKFEPHPNASYCGTGHYLMVSKSTDKLVVFDDVMPFLADRNAQINQVGNPVNYFCGWFVAQQ